MVWVPAVHVGVRDEEEVVAVRLAGVGRVAVAAAADSVQVPAVRAGGRAELETAVDESLDIMDTFPLLKEEVGRLAKEEIGRGETTTVDLLVKHVEAQEAFCQIIPKTKTQKRPKIAGP